MSWPSFSGTPCSCCTQNSIQVCAWMKMMCKDTHLLRIMSERLAYWFEPSQLHNIVALSRFLHVVLIGHFLYYESQFLIWLLYNYPYLFICDVSCQQLFTKHKWLDWRNTEAIQGNWNETMAPEKDCSICYKRRRESVPFEVHQRGNKDSKCKREERPGKEWSEMFLTLLKSPFVLSKAR